MDLLCTRCGEPWDLDYILHEAPLEFTRRGGLIEHCPSCPAEVPKLDPSTRERLTVVRELAELLGDDLDGLAAELEDFGLTR